MQQKERWLHKSHLAMKACMKVAQGADIELLVVPFVPAEEMGIGE